MRTGNPRTAAFLSVVACIAVGFALFRIFAPHPAASSAPGGASQNPPPPLPSDPRNESPFVYGDPFWHPKVASMMTSGNSPGGGPQEAPEEPPRAPLPVVPGLAAWNVPPPNQGAPPAEPPAPDQQSPKETAKTELVLKAVLRVSEPVAFISIQGKPTEVYKVGDELIPGVRIQSIDDHSVRLLRGKQKVVLTVGEKAQL
ncbi:MAG: hypothetical protein K6T17_07790 [Fimbriimonadales bacterium]|nr:hypothetical protein [Fimbriimonadales bacterium]